MADPSLPPSKFGAGFTVGAGFAPATRSAPASEGANRLAVSAFVTVLVLGIFVAPITFPVSFVAERQIRRSGQKGAGLATAAKIISGIYLLMGLVVLGLWLYVRTGDPAG